MAITTQTVNYHDGSLRLEALLVCDEQARRPAPAVMIAHAWAGRDDFAAGKARAVAELGYAGFALDIYGEGKRGSGPEENQRLMQPFVQDRALLQRRMTLALEAVKGLGEVDSSRVAAMGFCFGGMCVLDLARSGADLRGVASFHGLLGAPGNTAGKKIKAKVLVLHGDADPWAPVSDVVALEQELTEAGADWQIHVYGRTLHAFTSPDANSPESGAQYNAAADRRAWRSLVDFLGEIFA